MKATSHRAGGGFAALASHRLLWPAATLVLLCLLNWYFNPGFFHIELKSGHLYGSVIDILNRAAPLMLVAMGMTIVIAMRGIDISVGAVVAISGAVAASLIGGTLVIQNGAPVYVSNVPMSLAILGALGTALLCGVWNGVLVAGAGMQ
ncbi:MAG TPA: ABC transporter permease, partial [Noviherbaspirillum sp.]